jgi:hypothetical protein
LSSRSRSQVAPNKKWEKKCGETTPFVKDKRVENGKHDDLSH